LSLTVECPDPAIMPQTRPEGFVVTATIRVGAVNYLNTKPLVHELEAIAPNVDLVLDVPSRLADDLRAGRLDVALIPAIEYFRAGSYRIVPNIGHAARGPVFSVHTFRQTPLDGLRPQPTHER